MRRITHPFGRLALCGAVGFAALASLFVGASAQASPSGGHRLSGPYFVDEKVVSQSLPASEAAWPLGEVFDETWTFTPQCSTGTCKTAVQSSDQIVNTVVAPKTSSPEGDTSYSSVLAPETLNCALPGGRTVDAAYVVTGKLNFTYSAVNNAITGTLYELWVPNSVGKAGGCVKGRVSLSVTSTGTASATSTVPTTSVPTTSAPNTTVPSTASTVPASTNAPGGGVCPFRAMTASGGFQSATFISGLPYDPTLITTGVALDFAPCAGADAPTFHGGKIYVGDFYTGSIYVFGRSGGAASDATRLPDANFGTDNLFSLVFGRDGVLYATLFGNDALSPEVVELDPATGAEVRSVATLQDGSGLTYCPGRPAVSPINGDLFVPGECEGGSWGDGAITRIANPDSAHPVVSTYTVVDMPPGGLAFAPNGSLYAEVDWYSADEQVAQLAGPRTVKLPAALTVATVPGGYSYDLAVARRGSHGSASALQAANWQGDVYTIDLSSHPAKVSRDATGAGATGTGFTDGLGWGATRQGNCFYLSAGGAVERLCRQGSSSVLGSMARSLPTPSKAFRPLSSDLVNAGLAVGAALFITFPADIFNNTFAENYGPISAWWAKWLDIFLPPGLRQGVRRRYRNALQWVLGALHLSGRSREKRLEREWVTFGLVVVAGGLLGALLDPAFGLNALTVLTFLAIAGALVAAVALEGWATHFYHRARRHGRVPYKVEALPEGLGIALLCVVISRGTGFQPGYLYGVIAGVVFGRELAKDEHAHVVIVHSAARLVAGLLAWFAWAGLYHIADHRGSFFGAVLVDDFLAAFFVTTLVSTVISLLPLRFMPGEHLKNWHTGVWLGTFFVALFLMVQVLLRPGTGLASTGHSHVPLVTTLVLFLAFGALSLGFREYWARKERAERVAGTDEETGGAEADEGPQVAADAPGLAVITEAPAAAGMPTEGPPAEGSVHRPEG